MEEFYKKNKKKLSREAIIGLGEESFRKNYYGELQDKILELEKINIRNRALLKTIPDILLLGNREGTIMPFSYAANKINPLMMEILRSRRTLDTIRKGIEKVFTTKEGENLYFQLPREGHIAYMEARMNLTEMDEVLIIVRDISEEISMQKELRRMAERDSLTGLYNRSVFEKRMNELQENETQGLTLLLFDIDGLKIINDTLGTLVGDKLMEKVSRILEKHFGSEIILARIGGDEFAVLMIRDSQGEVEKDISELKRELALVNEHSDLLKVSLSYGYSYNTSGNSRVWSMFQEADNHMHQHKMLKESSTRSQLVKTLMKALEAKDYITEGHADRMEVLATLIARELRLPQSMVDKINLLTKFHDIGKVGIPDSILKKPGPLTPEEWEVMVTHTRIGERIAMESSELREVSYQILTHHEKWDGTGYPLGIAGNAIPLESRVLAISDAFDAMTNDRPYRKAMTIEEAVQEIEAQSGKQFDPALVEVFLKLFASQDTRQLFAGENRQE